MAEGLRYSVTLSDLTEEQARAVMERHELPQAFTWKVRGDSIGGQPVPMRDVLATPIELLRAAEGHPMVFKTNDGEEVRVRLLTVDEMMQLHADACAKIGLEPTLTRPSAEEITRPISSRVQL